MNPLQHVVRARAARVAFLFSLLLAMAAFTPRAFAREGFYLGAGLAHGTSTGDFNGTTSFVDSTGNQTIVAGKPGDTDGLNVMFGYGFNPYIGIELDLLSMGGIGSADVAGFPGKSTDGLGIQFLAARGTLPVTDHLDLFARLGLAGASYWFSSFRTINFGTVGTQPGGVTYYGSGLGAGIGAEYFIKNVGIGLGATQYGLTFDQTGTSGISALPNRLRETVDVVDLTVAYHFPPL
jgi:Outer membrane protein beta-barrel domain